MLSGHHSLLALVVVVLRLTVRLELVLQEPELASLAFPVGLHHLLLHAAVVDQQDGLRQHRRLVRVVLRVERPRRIGHAVSFPDPPPVEEHSNTQDIYSGFLTYHLHLTEHGVN